MRMSKRGRKRLILLVAALMVAGAGVATFVGYRHFRRDALVVESRTEGLEAYERGAYEEALPKLSYVIARNKQDLDALLAFADARKRIPQENNRHLHGAIAHYRAAIGIEPENIEALEGLLELYPRVGYRLEATDVADRIIEVDPEHIEARSTRALIALQDDDFATVAEHTQHLSRLEPRNLSWRALHIQTLQQQGDSIDAIIDLCQQWIEDDDDSDGRFHLLKAQLLVEAGRTDEAEIELNRAVDLGADDQVVLERMLDLLGSLAIAERTEVLLDSIRQRMPKATWVDLAAIRFYWRSQRFDDIQDLLAERRARFGDLTPMFHAWDGLLQATRGNAGAAREAVVRMSESAADLDPDERDQLRAWGEAVHATIALVDDDFSTALDGFDTAVSLAPGEPIFHYLLAIASQQAGEHILALAFLDRSGQLDSTWNAIDLARAESLLAIGQPARAFQILGAIVRQTPSSTRRTYVLLARSWLALGNVGEQLSLNDTQSGDRFTLVGLLSALREDAPGDTELDTLYARALLQEGLDDEFDDLCRNAIREEQENSDLLLKLADISRAAGVGNSRALLNAAERKGGTSAASTATRAVLMQEEGQTDEALRMLAQFQASAAGEETEGLIKRSRIEVLIAAGRTEDALVAMMELLESNNETVSAATFILNQDVAWQRPALVRSAIDLIKAEMGTQSVRAVLYNAVHTQRFQRDDPEAVAAAIDDVQAVLELMPDAKYPLQLMAGLVMVGDNPNVTRATQLLRRAVEHHPGDASLYPRLIGLLQQQGDFETAALYLDRMARAGGGGEDIRRVEIELLQAQGDFEAAAERLNELLPSSDSIEDQVELATLYHRSGRLREAETLFLQLIEKPATTMAVAEKAADFFAATGRYDAGLLMLHDEPDLDEPTRMIALGRYCIRNGRLRDAETFLDQARELAPRDDRVWSARADLHLVRSEVTRARDALIRAMELDPEDDDYKTRLAVVSLSLGSQDRQSAITALESLDQPNPALLSTLRLYERSVRQQGNGPDQALLAAARELVEDYPRFWPAWRLTINLHAEAGDFDEAIDLARVAATKLPAQAAPAEMATRMLLQQGQLQEAFSLARMWRVRSQDDPIDPDEIMAAIELDRGNGSRAYAILLPHGDRIVADRDRNRERFMLWLDVLLAEAAFARAWELAEPLVGTEPEFTSAWLDRAIRFDEVTGHQLLVAAESSLGGGIADRIELANMWNRHGRRFGQEESFRIAAGLLDGLDDDSMVVPLNIVRAMIASNLGEFSAAEACYRAALDNDPDNIVALNNLADMLTKRGERCDEAVDLASRALQQMPSEPTVIDTLCSALICAGRSTQAESMVREALSAAPDDALLHLALAGALVAQERWQDARSSLNRARSAFRRTDEIDPALQQRLNEIENAIESITSG